MSLSDARFAVIPGDAIPGDAALVARIDGARRHLAVLRSFHEEVRSTSHATGPAGARRVAIECGRRVRRRPRPPPRAARRRGDRDRRRRVRPRVLHPPHGAAPRRAARSPSWNVSGQPPGSDGGSEPGVADGVGVAGVPGSLVVSGGGSIAVATDDLFVHAARLGATTAVVTDWIDRAAVMRRGLGELDLDSPTLIGAAGSPTLDLAFAAMCLDQVLDHATWLRSSLLEAAERYGATERFVDGLWQLAAFGGAAWLGLHAPLLVAGGLLAAGGAWAGSAVWRAAGWGSTPLGAWLDEHRTVLSDPDFVRLVRATVDHVDEAVAVAAHVPSSGLLGLPVRAPESASVVLGLAGAIGALGVAGGRVLVDGPVRVTRLDRATAAGASSAAVPPGHPAEAAARLGDVVEPPAGIGDLADRVPRGDTAAQVRIERYGTADDPRWIVYVGGTVDFGLTAGEQPADMTSNLHGIADDSGVDALRLAGAPSARRRARRAPGHERSGRAARRPAARGGLLGRRRDRGEARGRSRAQRGRRRQPRRARRVGPDPRGRGPALHRARGGPRSGHGRCGASVTRPGHRVAQRARTRARVRGRACRRTSWPATGRRRRSSTGPTRTRLASFRSLVGEVTGGGAGLRSDWVATRELSPSTPDAR